MALFGLLLLPACGSGDGGGSNTAVAGGRGTPSIQGLVVTTEPARSTVAFGYIVPVATPGGTLTLKAKFYGSDGAPLAFLPEFDILDANGLTILTSPLDVKQVTGHPEEWQMTWNVPEGPSRAVAIHIRAGEIRLAATATMNIPIQVSTP
jgi:hypothetical protein